MTTPTPPTTPPVAIDVQDPLPESSWSWRRGYVFAGAIVQAIAFGFILAALWETSRKLGSMDSVQGLLSVAGLMYKLAWWLLIIHIIDKVLYLIAPSAEQATKMIQTAGILKAGVPIKSQQQYVATEGQVAATSTTEAGNVTISDSTIQAGTDTSPLAGSLAGGTSSDPDDYAPTKRPN